MTSRTTADPVEGTFHYEGRGYDDPRAVELAEVFFTMQRELSRGSNGGSLGSEELDMTPGPRRAARRKRPSRFKGYEFI